MPSASMLKLCGTICTSCEIGEFPRCNEIVVVPKVVMVSDVIPLILIRLEESIIGVDSIDVDLKTEMSACVSIKKLE